MSLKDKVTSFLSVALFLMSLSLVGCGGGSGGVANPEAPSSVPGSTHSSGTSGSTSGGDKSVTIKWIAPSSREDNTPLALSEIDGYKIYYGTSSGVYTNHVDIPDGSADQVTISNLFSGTYYFVLTTIDIYGRESGYSDEVIRTL